MNKLLKAFCIGLGIITQQLHSISLIDYIQQYGMPKVVGGTLNLAGKNLTDLTGLQDIPNIDQVRELDLSFNKLQTLPDIIFNGLHNLQVLYLHNNQIQTLSSNIFNGLQNLEYLTLDDNQIQVLPDTIFNGLYNLGELYLGNNQLKTLPDTVFNGLHNLRTLSLYKNQIQTLPDTIFNGLENLSVLNLKGNSFTPDFIPTLTDLLLNLPKLSKINGMPKRKALQKEPFVTLKKLAAANIALNLNKYWPNLHKLPEDILDLLPLTELQRQEIEKRHVA